MKAGGSPLITALLLPVLVLLGGGGSSWSGTSCFFVGAVPKGTLTDAEFKLASWGTSRLADHVACVTCVWCGGVGRKEERETSGA